MTLIAVFDYGSGNLHSATRALEATGAIVRLTTDPAVAAEADGLVVPGVGAFSECIRGLRDAGGAELIAARVAANAPILGICVGHQVLFTLGVEHGVREPGLGLFDGVVEQLTADRLPHMGWNTVEVAEDSRLFAGVEQDRFYFVHSYGVHTDPGPDTATTWTEHGGDRFVAAVERGPVSSTQFHPEKSGSAGARMLRNWVTSVG